LYAGFERVEQDNWDDPQLPLWSARLDQLRAADARPTLVVAHSFGSLTAVHSIARDARNEEHALGGAKATGRVRKFHRRVRYKLGRNCSFPSRRQLVILHCITPRILEKRMSRLNTVRPLRPLLAALALATGISPALAETLKVGYLPVTGHAKFFVAKEQGLFAKEGLDVELIEFQNSADGLNAVVAGKLDIGAFGTTAPLAHIAKGAKLKIIGGLMGGDAAVITTAANAGKVAGISDLKGKKIATVRMASGDAVLRGALKDKGINWKSDLQIFELKNPAAVIQSVKSGQVDAGLVWGPHDLRAEDQGLKVVIHSTDLQPGHPCCRLVVTEAGLKNQVACEKFLRAILRAEKFAAENKKETIDAIAKYVKIDRQLLWRGYYSPYLDQSSDPDVKGVKHFADVMVNSGFIAAKPNLDAAVDVRIYAKVLNALAKENPGDPFWRKLQKQFKQKDV
jgi:NitT/TauT family transport system substrate-binding protein